MKRILLIVVSFLFISMLVNAQKRLGDEPIVTDLTNKVVLSKDVKYDQLNPARGDKSPMAGDIWGDRKDTVASGFLLKFADGFSSPPHIHNITYRAIVISGLVDNGDKNAEKMWMPTGSFWTQPLGAGHITAAKGKNAMAYVEIDKGPYLVEPTDSAFKTKEKPINIDISNVVWLDKSVTKWIKNGNSQIGFLWSSKNNDGIKGFLIKLPKNFNGNIYSMGSIFHAVVIQGDIDYKMPITDKIVNLDPGSSFSSSDIADHDITNVSKTNAIIYVRTNSSLIINQNN